METISLETKGLVAWVWLDRSRRLNAINEGTLAELRQTFEALDRDEEVRAETLASLPPHAVQLAKKAFARSRRSDFAAWEQEKFAECWALPEQAAAMQAFIGKG